MNLSDQQRFELEEEMRTLRKLGFKDLLDNYTGALLTAREDTYMGDATYQEALADAMRDELIERYDEGGTTQ